MNLWLDFQTEAVKKKKVFGELLEQAIVDTKRSVVGYFYLLNRGHQAMWIHEISGIISTYIILLRLPLQSTTNWILSSHSCGHLKSKKRCQQGHDPSEDIKERFVPFLYPHFWWFADNLWCLLACRFITMICGLHVYVIFSPC